MSLILGPIRLVLRARLPVARLLVTSLLSVAAGTPLGAQRPASLDSAGIPTPLAQAQPSAWALRAELDSGEVQGVVTPTAAVATIVAPTGTFVQRFDTSQSLVDWSYMLGMLEPPVAVPATSDSGPTIRYWAVTLADPRGPAGSAEQTVFRLTRVDGAGRPAYILTGTNGAWGFAIRLDST